MGKDEAASDSKFGFKDKDKALETIKLLAEHDMQYQKLTVRGLLGRAKRVLSMTKAEEKKTNIQSAIKVFEDWLEKNTTAKSAEKTSKSSNDEKEKPDTVPGLGFKDKEAALKTLKILDGRDPNYQKLAIKGLLGNAKRVLQATKDETKIKSIKDGVKILDDYLNEKLHSLENLTYLPVDTITAFESPKSKLCSEFIETYGGKAKGRYEFLRTLYPKDDDSKSWDIVRNSKLGELKSKLKANNAKLFNDDGSPTKEHIELIQWAYSPNVDKLKQHIESANGGSKSSSSKKRKSSSDHAASGSEKKSRSKH